MSREAGAAAPRYVDEAVPAPRRRSENRVRGCRGFGYTVERSGGESIAQTL